MTPDVSVSECPASLCVALPLFLCVCVFVPLLLSLCACVTSLRPAGRPPWEVWDSRVPCSSHRPPPSAAPPAVQRDGAPRPAWVFPGHPKKAGRRRVGVQRKLYVDRRWVLGIT